MRKVLIADDDMLVRVGLKSTVPWEDNAFLVVGDAKNGKEAIEMFEEFDPDILITDIRMPIINGLELIKTLKERKSSLKTVIISHHDDFNYAKEAIKLGASEYILKSDLCPEILIEILRKLVNELDDNDTKESSSYKDSQNKTMTQLLNKQIFLKKFYNKNFETTEEMEEFVEKKRIKFSFDKFIAAFAKVHIKSVSNEEQDISNTIYDKETNLLKKSIENIAKQIFSDSYISYTLYLEGRNASFLFNFDSNGGKSYLAERIFEKIALLKKNLNRFLNIDIIVGLSDIGHSVKEIHQLMKKTRIAYNHCFFEHTGIVAYKDNMIIKGVCPEINFESIKGYFKTLDSEYLIAYIESIFDELYKLKEFNFVKDIFIDFLSHGKIIANELNLINKPTLKESKFSYDVFLKLQNFESAKKYIIEIFRELATQRNDNKPRSYSQVINKCIQYIKKNYNKNIALTDAAENVQVSKCYLSLLFKQETGINFCNFLTDYRIEKSKKLLKESNLKMYEIAEQVGIDNPYYFSKLFKDSTGISCTEYKKLNNESIQEQ